jgi:hypothetical protein
MGVWYGGARVVCKQVMVSGGLFGFHNGQGGCIDLEGLMMIKS